MSHGRRSFLSGLAAAIPFGLASRVGASPTPVADPPGLRFRSFEDNVRAAFAGRPGASGPTCRRVEVGHSDLVREGLQGCLNDRPFAGFPAGALKIVRATCEPGPARGGVRLFVTALDVALVEAGAPLGSGRPLNFACLPPSASFE